LKVFPEDKHAILISPLDQPINVLVESILSVARPKLCYREKLTPHGEKIANYMLERNLMVDFIKLWRQHFMDTMKPTSMPFMWDDYSHIYDIFQVPHPKQLYTQIELKSIRIRRTTDAPLI